MRGRVGRAVRGDGLAGDILFAALLLVIWWLLWLLSPGRVWPRSLPLAGAWDALGMVPVVLRRRWLWWSVAILTGHTVVSSLGVPDLDSVGLAVLVVTYTAAARLSLARALAATSLIWVPGMSIAMAAQWGRPQAWNLAPGFYLMINVMAALVCFFVGRTVWTRRAYIAALEDRARAAEASQQVLTQQAVAEERRRIARELHDVVAHHVSVMSVLATGARRSLRTDPVAADEALRTVAQTGGTALREMRRMLDVLRGDDAEPAGELRPQPGVAGINALAEQVREAGLPVSLIIDKAIERLDPGIALAVYRVVQEALTNALKHAGPATVEVRLAIEGCGLVVEVCDNGRGPGLEVRPAGHGLAGMRERVGLYGGTLRTGPRPGGGYRVSAKIPLEPPMGTDSQVRGAAT